MTTTAGGVLVPVADTFVFAEAERLALVGFLAGYRGATRDAYRMDLRLFTYDSVTENVATGDRKRRAIVFYGLFVAWPATALLVIASGTFFGLSGWFTIGGWAAASFVALAAHAGMQVEAAGVQADSDT
jgi:hypothetical protein